MQWKAQWCWTRMYITRPWNYYAYFRRQVTLKNRPERAIVRVSADARYTLFVNGERVHQGPARCFPNTQAYDTLDIVQYLQPGENTICAIVHMFGVPTFFALFRALGGFILDGTIETVNENVSLHTPGDWLCREAKGWRKDVARLTLQLGFQEHFDADADPPDWMTPGYQPTEEAGWRPAMSIVHLGRHPWLKMEPRGVPLLADHVENFASVVAQFRAENARGYKVSDDVYHLPLQEQYRKDGGLVENADAMLKPNAEVTTIQPAEGGAAVMAVLDLGQYRTGHIMLDIAAAAGDEIIDIIYSEDLEKNRMPLILQGTHCEEATADRYRCRPGAQRWEAFHYKGMKYATLIFRNVEKPLQVRHVALRQVHAAVDDIGSFQCSDERLNQIWRVARETQRNCLFDAFVDCPWREQAMWWGDARVQSLVTQYAFGDTSVLARGIKLVAQSQAPDGALHAHPPADVPRHHLPDFMMTWVGSLWDYYFHTGQVQLLRECLPAMHRVFEFFKSHEGRDGLIGDFEGWWVFLDWQELFRRDYSGVLNMMYLQAFRWAATICQLCGEQSRAVEYSQRAAALEQAVEKHFWDDANKQWRDGYDAATDKPVEEVSQHMNTLAILMDLKPETHVHIAREILLKSARAKRTKIKTASPFFYAYVLEAMARTGQRADVIDIIRDKWGEMIDRGATTFWEMWEVTRESRCHAWSSSPLYHLAQQVLGVVPVSPGWKKVRIAPFAQGLDFAKGVVPSPLGRIVVEWEKVEEDQLAMRVEIPHGMEAEFVSPLGETRDLDEGTHEFHT